MSTNQDSILKLQDKAERKHLQNTYLTKNSHESIQRIPTNQQKAQFLKIGRRLEHILQKKNNSSLPINS